MRHHCQGKLKNAEQRARDTQLQIRVANTYDSEIVIVILRHNFLCAVFI